jgi:hypothetical protein
MITVVKSCQFHAQGVGELLVLSQSIRETGAVRVPVPSHDRSRGWDRWDPQSMLISTGGGDILRLLLLVSESEHDAVWRLVDRRSQGESSPLRTGVLAQAWVFRVG